MYIVLSKKDQQRTTSNSQFVSYEILTETPLQLAIKGGYTEVVEILVLAGADIEAKDADGNTPLLLAARKGELAIAKVLCSAGAGIDQRKIERTMMENPAMMEILAETLQYRPTQIHQLDVVFLAIDHQRQDVLEMLLSRLRQDRFKIKWHLYYLPRAMKCGNLDAVKVFVSEALGFDESFRSLHTAIVDASEYKQWRMMEYLIDKYKATHPDLVQQAMRIALCRAVGFHHHEVIQSLLARGADYRQQDEAGGNKDILEVARENLSDRIRKESLNPEEVVSREDLRKTIRILEEWEATNDITKIQSIIQDTATTPTPTSLPTNNKFGSDIELSELEHIRTADHEH